MAVLTCPDICLVFTYHSKFNDTDINDIREGCKSGSLGCFDCKMKISGKLNNFFLPVREKRKEFENDKKKILDILVDGENKARKIAEITLDEVREAMRFG